MTQHAELGASNAERWMNCPGSVAATRGLPDEPSIYAREGTAAHALAERSLRKQLAPDTWLDTQIDGIDVTEEMTDAVTVFVTEVMRFVESEPDAVLLIEHKLDLNALNPPAPMFGTADAVVFLPRARKLVVLDLKYGAGVAKDAAQNPQLYYYGLGALLAFEQERKPGLVDDVEVVIVQPRAYHTDGIVRRAVYDVNDMVGFAGDLLAAARAARAPDAPLVPGDWCRFCRAAPTCPALQGHAQSLAQVEFELLPADAPPDPKSLSTEALAHILDNADILENWLRAVREHVQASLERGEDVPGWKIVPRRAIRRWVSESVTREWLEARGYSPDEYTVTKLKSPAQVEKLLKSDKEVLAEDLYDKTSSGYTLAPDDDPRPAVALDPVSEFALLPPGDSVKPDSGTA